uniref:ApaG domain-containing protein n=1 Tax=Steinernema glaseri TaxID=37863 RepID=A0A1I7Y313_9BILA
MTGHEVTLRERVIKVFSMNQLNQTSAHGIGVSGIVPILTPTQPVFQFSSTIDLQQLKGGQMWGKFKLEREDGGKFKLEREDGSFVDVAIPNVPLEACPDKPAEQSESVVH